MNHTLKGQAAQPPVRMGWIGTLVLYLVFIAVVARTLAVEGLRPLLPTFLAAELIFVALQTAVNIAPRKPTWLLHLYFGFQSALIVWLLSLYADFDFLILLYLLLSFQASLVFSGRTRWGWVGAFVLLSGGSLIYFHGLAHGLALSLTTMAAELVIPAYVIVHHENETARGRSQALLGELQEANQQLEMYSHQAGDLAALQERNRLARELHDTVSQVIFSISLTARSAQVLLIQDPERVPEQLDRLKALSGEALAQLRSLITKMRPPQAS